MLNRTILTLSALCFFALSANVDANFIPTALSVTGLSDPIDLIAIQVNPAGAHLASPTFTITTDDEAPPFGSGSAFASGWTEGYNDGIIAIATGPGILPDFFATFEYLGSSSPYAQEVVLFSGSKFVTGGGASNGVAFPSWDANRPTRAELDLLLASSVPEPATLALLGLAIAGMTSVRRRKLNW
jgi:hypothetical protein